MRTPVKKIAEGRWPSILPQLGVSKDFLVNKHGPCPLCEGKDRFRFDDNGHGMWFCNQCGSGDGVALAMKYNRWEFKEAAREIEKAANGAPIAVRKGPDIAKVKATMNSIWRSGIPLTAHPATVAWWKSRVGDVPIFPDLRAVSALNCPEHGDHPGMVALVRDSDGKPVNLHRTYLTMDGRKAEFGDPRRVMPVPLPKGSCVRLGVPGDELGIAEGIETAIAVTKLFNVPCWAALNAGNMEGWIPPPDVKVVIFGDNDRSYTGQASAFALAKRLMREKRTVRVRLPTQIGWDWNDVLLSAGEVTAANSHVELEPA